MKTAGMGTGTGGDHQEMIPVMASLLSGLAGGRR